MSRISRPNRSVIWKVSFPAYSRAAPREGPKPPRRAARRAERTRCAAHDAHGALSTARATSSSIEEKWKRDEHPFEAYARLKRAGEERRSFPSPSTISAGASTAFSTSARHRTLHVPAAHRRTASSTHWQFEGVADIAEKFGGGYTHVTTRANLQIREIKAETRVRPLLEGLVDLGLTLERLGRG